MRYCADFDDFCDATIHTLDTLVKIKARVPTFRATLFTIPMRTSPATIAAAKSLGEWLALAPHGWRHTRGECLAWPLEEAIDKMRLAHEMGLNAPAFRAPAWLLDRTTYEACHERGLVVCDHRDYRSSYPTKVYTYNYAFGRQPKVRPVHGHLTRCAVDNHIEDMYKDGRLKFHQLAAFAFPWEVAVDNPLREEALCES